MKFQFDVMSVVAYVKRQMIEAESHDQIEKVDRMDVKSVLANAIHMLDEKDKFGRYEE